MTTSEAAPVQPMFYRTLEPLRAAEHADWRLTPGDAAFAAETAYVPIVVGELAAAARDYPVVFAAGGSQPVAILGLEQRNLFVDAGQWLPDTYVPAYVRRYPFGFLATTSADRFALGIDVESDRVAQGGEAGHALFAEGKPTDITAQALAFCEAFQGEALATRDFVQALETQDILVDRRADATLPDGRKLGLDGFRIVDADKVSALADDVVLDWHRKGWLGLVSFHLASLGRFSFLLDRQAAVMPVSSDGGSESDRELADSGLAN